MYRRTRSVAGGADYCPGPAGAGSRLRAALAVTAAAAAVAVVPAAPAAAVPPASPVDVITIFAGTGSNGSPVAGPAVNSPLGELRQMALDAAGNLYAADYDNSRVIKVTPDGTLSIIAGDGTHSDMVPGPALSSPLNEPSGLAVDTAGNVYVSDYNNRIAKITPAGQLSIVAGDGSDNNPVPGPALSSPFDDPVGLAVDRSGNLYVADHGADVVAKVTPAGQLSIVVGGGGTSGPPVSPTPATDLDIDVNGVAADSAGNLYVSDYSDCYVIKVTPAGSATNFAGAGSCSAPTPGPATASDINEIYHLSVDAADNVYIADYYEDVVEKVTPGGTLSVYGTGSSGPPSYGSPMSGSPLGAGYSAVANAAGVVYFSNVDNATIDRIGPVGPSAPRDLRITPGDGTLALSFLPPHDSGLSPLDSYLVSLDGGTTWQPLTTTPSGGRLTATIPGLTNGTTYNVAVQAINAEYGSPFSTTVPGTPAVSTGDGGLAITGVKVATITGVGLLILLLGISLVARSRRHTTRPASNPAR